MTTWQEIKKDFEKWFKELSVFLIVFYSGMTLWEGVISPSEREGTVETGGCRTTIVHKKRPLLDSHIYTCVYERDDTKKPDRITGKYCVRVETENGICTLAEIYSAPGSSVETPGAQPETCRDPHERLGPSGLCFCEPGYHSDPTTLKCSKD